MNDSEVMTHFTSGAVIVYVLEGLKQWGVLSWIRTDTKTLNRMISFGAAMVIALGITWEGSWDAGWTWHIPSGPMLLTLGWEGVKQAITQQMIYQTAVETRTVKVVS